MGKPKIRFKGYEDAWEQRKLDGWGTFYYGRSCPKWSVTEDATIPCIRYGELYTKFGAKIDRVYSYTNMPPENLRFSKGTEVLIPRVGEDPMDYNHCTWLSMPDVAIGEMISVFNTDNNPLFTATMFNATLQNEFAMRVEGGSVTNLYFEKLKNIEVSFPSIQEQEKIAAYFENLDHLITLHQRKYDETKTLKKYMLQKMFPQNGEKVPEIRFDGFTEDWEQRKLGEVCEIKDSARIPNSEWSESGIPYIRASDVTNENTDGVLFISQERYEFYKNRTGAPTKNDVLFNGGGEIGKSLLITDEKPIYVQGGAVLYARTSKSRELVGQYLKTYFETTNAKSYIDAASAGGTMRHFTLKPSQKMRILMPSVEEQEKIGGYFVNLDRLITLHQRKCDELQSIKKFMLQNMFI